MEISVVIPVYNAARFLTEAVDSVLQQPEVKEILLVDDGSTDDSLAFCHQLAERYPDVITVLRHADGANKGAAATRNAGMRNARHDFIAFLDADDLYCEERFSATESIFGQNADCDAVHETVVSIVYGETGSTQIDPRAGHVTAGFKTIIAPEALFKTLAIGDSGYIHLNGFVLRRSALDSSMYFDEELRQCQDTDLLLRWAAERRIIGGDPDRVVAHRRVHATNTVFNTEQTRIYRYQMMKKCALAKFYGLKDSRAKWAILNRMARATRPVAFARELRFPVTPFRLMVIFVFLLRYPKVINYLKDN